MEATHGRCTKEGIGNTIILMFTAWVEVQVEVAKIKLLTSFKTGR